MKDFARHVHGDLLRQVALRHRGRHFCDVADLAGQVRCHRVDRVGQILPGARHAAHHRLAAEFSFGADFARDARHFAGESVELVHHGVNGVLELENLTAHVHGDFFRQVAVGDGGRHFGDVTHLAGEIAGHRIHGIGQIFPSAGNAEHVGLTAQPAFGADFARDARHFAGEGVELVHHRVDGFFQLQDFARHVDGDLLRQVAAGNSGRHIGDVADLRGQVAGHEIDAVGQVFPGARDARHRGLTAEFAFGSHFARDARHFRSKAVELVHHRIDGVFQFENFAAHIHRDFSRKVAAGDGSGHLRDVSHLVGQVAAHGVDRVGQVFPGSGDARDDSLSTEFAVGADLARNARHL